jgi:hypothetical protein
VPDIPERDGRVVLCSRNVLDRARRKFGLEGDLYARMELVKEKQDIAEQGGMADGIDHTKKDEGLEGWLVEWDELPEGCVVLPGRIESDWKRWGIVR